MDGPLARITRVEPTGLLSSTYRLLDGAESRGELRFGLRTARGTIRLGEAEYELRGRGLFDRRYTLSRDGVEVIDAPAAGFLLTRVTIPAGGRPHVLRQRFSLMTEFDCLADGVQVGSIRAEGLFGRVYRVDLPADWTLLEQAFAAGIAIIEERSQSSS
jgi:hypothetical protein